MMHPNKAQGAGLSGDASGFVTSTAINLINWLPFCDNSRVSYLEPLYGTLGDGASWSTIFFSLFFGKLQTGVTPWLLTLFPGGGSGC
jgi:hypothetical protein